MKKLVYIGVLISMVFVSCDKKSSMDSYDWEGVYTIETTIEYINADGTSVMNIYGEDSEKTLSSEINIYKENNNLYVQTQYFGTPDTTLKNTYYRRLQKRKIQMYNMDINYSTELIKVNSDNISSFLFNGLIFIIKYGNIYTAPLPAQVKYITPNKLTFYPSQNFTLPLVFISNFEDYTEYYIRTVVDCQYLFGDMKKNGNKITWDITLQIDYPNDYTIADKDPISIIYHSIAVKK